MDLRSTSQQRKAIEAPSGPTLVVAGPGAGKTFCLIGRIGYLIASLGFRPERICAVTFTNKAAEEIAERLREVLGAAAEDVKRGTIHALCLEILREHAARAGLKAGFGVADEDYQETVLRRLRQARRARQLMNLFGRRRLQGYRLTEGDEALFRQYRAELRRRNVVDFDDLIALAARLFVRHPDVADAVAARWDCLLVDEFQDVNETQYAILKRLAAAHRNVFAVGDDEQSIFAFTGADPAVLRRFQHDFGIAAPIVLDRNHRSAEQIFGVARRLLAANPSLFEKQLDAPRQSVHPVRAFAFEDDETETDWIIRDLAADQGESGLAWGEYAILYRLHEVGDRLEGRLVRAGVPCRLARGRPLADDPVIGYVIAALRLVRRPSDAVAAESFAGRVLPPHLLERVQAEVGAAAAEVPFLLAVRDLAGGMRGDPDAKHLWRLIYQVENFAGLSQAHSTLAGLVYDLLGQRTGAYRNPLAERHEDLTDPADVPEAVALAERLLASQRVRSRVILEPMGGLDIPLRGLLFEAGFRLVRYADEIEQTELDDLRIGPDDGGRSGLALTLFKALQLLHARDIVGAPPRYVTFDLETTDLDTTSCDIVDIAAVRVEGGRITDTFNALVRPGQPMSAGARRATGYSDADLVGQPSFAEVWPRFRAFVGSDVLVAHNAQHFDVPVLRRMAAPLGGTEAMVFFDTLPLARSLSGDSARLEALAQRFGIDAGRAHRALDDALTLAGVYQELERRRQVRSRKAALVNLLSYLGLALVLDPARPDTEEERLIFDVARIQALGRFSDCLDVYEAERTRRAAGAPPLAEVIERLGGSRLMEKLREEPDPARKYPAALARLEALIEQGEGEPLESAVDRFLERVALSRSHGAQPAQDGVNLLTLHATKGLEFSRVYVVGVEDEQLPGWTRPDEDAEAQLQEARRLLYVGMTRAKDRLVLTRVDRRAGRPSGGSRFLEEMQLDVLRLGEVAQPLEEAR